MASLEPGVFGVFGVLGVFGLFTFSSCSDLCPSTWRCSEPQLLIPLGLEVQVARAFEDSALRPESRISSCSGAVPPLAAEAAALEAGFFPPFQGLEGEPRAVTAVTSGNIPKTH